MSIICRRSRTICRTRAPFDPLWNLVATTVAPNFDFKEGQGSELRHFCVVLACEDRAFLYSGTLLKVSAGRDCSNMCCAHFSEYTVECIREEFRAGWQLHSSLLTRDVLLVVHIYLTQKFDTVKVSGYSRDDMMVAEKSNSAVGDGFRPANGSAVESNAHRWISRLTIRPVDGDFQMRQAFFELRKQKGTRGESANKPHSLSREVTHTGSYKR